MRERAIAHLIPQIHCQNLAGKTALSRTMTTIAKLGDDKEFMSLLIST